MRILKYFTFILFVSMFVGSFTKQADAQLFWEQGNRVFDRDTLTSDTLSSSDTVRRYDFQGKWRTATVDVVDVSGSNTDTLKFYDSTSTGLIIPLRAINLSSGTATTTTNSVISPGAGLKARFLIEAEYINRLIIVMTQVEFVRLRKTAVEPKGYKY